LGFQCDNGSEFINHTARPIAGEVVGGVQQIAANRTTDSALVEKGEFSEQRAVVNCCLSGSLTVENDRRFHHRARLNTVHFGGADHRLSWSDAFGERRQTT